MNQNNERMLLVNILNRMYNDNLTQIDRLQESNRDIRNLVTELLYINNNNYQNTNQNVNQNNSNASNRRQGSTAFRRQNSNRGTNTNNPLNRFNIGGQPLIIDNYEEFYIPRTLRGLTNPNTNTNAFNSNGISRIFENFFDPVPVYPTQTQIEAATRRVRYCDIVTPLNTSCPISLEPFNDSDNVTVIRHCGHIFNTTEINNWFRSNCVCPVCRYDIRNYRPHNYANTSRSSINNTDTNIDVSNTDVRNPDVSNNISETNTPFTSNNLEPQYYIDLLYDLSGNFLSDGSDANSILNIFANLLQRRGRL